MTTQLLLTPFRPFHVDALPLADLFQYHLFCDTLHGNTLEAAKQFVSTLEGLPELEITNLQEYKSREKAIIQIESKLLEGSSKFNTNIRETLGLMCGSLSDQRYYMEKNLSWIDVLNKRDQAEKCR